ncbi:XRE family transcriptional regulator [Helicobacter saguini]|uniref:XRE family transcriptional regulator n=1 Tax=Helicobacter saguini TaxID=1548018 RepID=A0A347VR76_9HELI|nr:helix-turn-helix transcriptional regulator [Helicobacter saguini]MWV63008.1 XRE family transcriptional regulator [Helicobacter saguini]MWV66323.1 XRE family transcriptional regulator [Helicobacter saguini]MWV68675.1 XRE family transcriptional regulator [Helicobacter saguini]MWV71774.1 XRE family transcriptional regulator [Helicobacter saguini]TLD95803.1 XRE family transcriptional regulator [Helicobacter saguini]
MNENLNVNFNTILVIVLKELRLERNIHQATLADICNKQASAWNKIENGKSPLVLETLYRVCNYAFHVQPSIILATAERFANIFAQHNYAILYNESESEDIVLKYANQYYKMKSQQNFMQSYAPFVSILNMPCYEQNGRMVIGDVFQYCLNEIYKDENHLKINQQLNYNKGV